MWHKDDGEKMTRKRAKCRTICKQKEEHAGEEFHMNSRRSMFTRHLRKNWWAILRADSENGRVGCLPGGKIWAHLWKGSSERDHSQEWKKKQWYAWHLQIRTGVTQRHWRPTVENWEMHGRTQSGAILLVPEETKRWTKCWGWGAEKGIQREKNYHKHLRIHATSWNKFSDLLLLFLYTKTKNLKHLVLIKKKKNLKYCNLWKASLLLPAVLRIPPTS